MMFRRNGHSRRPFGILDIGSTKICCMIGEHDKLGGARLLGQGTHASAGIRAGEVTALADLSDAIGNAVQTAERAAGVSLTAVSVVLAGGSPRSSFSKQSMTCLLYTSPSPRDA